MDFDHRDHERLEEMVQQTRWDEVTDARQRVLDRLQAIDRLQFETRGPVAEDRVATLYQRTVQLYVQQVETILDPDEAPATEWWEDRWIAEFDLPNEDVVEIAGLVQYVDLDEKITYTVTEEQRQHGWSIGQLQEVERTVVPPVGVHRNAFRATNRALADQGIEFDTRERDLGDGDLAKGGSL